ncbi:hypothetical protein L6452_37143 [Arctium lappa]|uniref:Uncharacterized protein n=1 Tax=Arctium lappa TaxID=4217 RepID=A0ACB8Y248_ARCLA|nr:hypothetical protein L6452_37143 [Arctium lappa]
MEALTSKDLHRSKSYYTRISSGISTTDVTGLRNTSENPFYIDDLELSEDNDQTLSNPSLMKQPVSIISYREASSMGIASMCSVREFLTKVKGLWPPDWSQRYEILQNTLLPTLLQAGFALFACVRFGSA